MLKERIIEKFTQILAAIPAEQQAALAAELAKMMPANGQADVDWRVGWGYDIDKDEVGVGISLKIVPATPSTQAIPLIDLLTNAVNMGKEEQLLKLKEALDIALDDILLDRIITFLPSVYFAEVTSAVHFSFRGEPSAQARQYGEQKREALSCPSLSLVE
jgi:hypothetical protein